MICAKGAVVDFLAANGEDGEQEEICYQWRRHKVHGEVEAHEAAGAAGASERRILQRGASFRGHDAQHKEKMCEAIWNLSWEVDGNVEREKHDNVCGVAERVI